MGPGDVFVFVLTVTPGPWLRMTLRVIQVLRNKRERTYGHEPLFECR